MIQTNSGCNILLVLKTAHSLKDTCTHMLKTVFWQKLAHVNDDNDGNMITIAACIGILRNKDDIYVQFTEV